MHIKWIQQQPCVIQTYITMCVLKQKATTIHSKRWYWNYFIFFIIIILKAWQTFSISQIQNQDSAVASCKSNVNNNVCLNNVHKNAQKQVMATSLYFVIIIIIVKPRFSLQTACNNRHLIQNLQSCLQNFHVKITHL